MEGHQDSGGIQSGVLGGGIYSDAIIRDMEDACHVKLIGAKLSSGISD